MKMFYKLMVVVAITSLLATEFISSAAVLSTNVTAGRRNVLTNSCRIKQITVANTSGGVANVRVYNSPNSNVLFTNGAYTNFLISAITCTNIFTNVLGRVQTNSFPCITNTMQSFPATEQAFELLSLLTVPNGTTLNNASSSGYIANMGINITNDATVTVTIEYDPWP